MSGWEQKTDESRETPPTPDWTEAVPALAEALAPWVESRFNTYNMAVVLGAPHSHMDVAVAAWATANGCITLDAPSMDHILTGNEIPWQGEPSSVNDAVYVIPALEEWFLRSPNGLDTLRRLLDRACAGKIRIVAGCQSWAWAFLSKAVQLELMADAYTLEPLNAHRLQEWCVALGNQGGVSLRNTLRQADTDAPVITNDRASSDFMVRLAAYSCGIPGVAWALWRDHLVLVPGARDDGDLASVRVKPWLEASHLALPGRLAQPDCFVLHAILMHQAISREMLAAILPLSLAETAQSLHRLQMAGFLERINARWLVTPQGYPAVREKLREQRYLVDPL